MDDVNQKAYAAEEAEKKKEQEKQQNDEENDDEEEDETDDSEEDEIYRNSPTSEVPKKKKYTTRNPANKDSQKAKPSAEKVEEEKKPLEVRPAASQLKTKRPQPINMIEMTTAGDLVLLQRPTSTYSSNMDRLGEVVTPSTLNMLTSTIVSTSMKGSATLKPEDTPFSIPLKTNGRDDAEEDDDEEDDNQKYEDDNEEDSSTFHRVTLEELVGDINLTPDDFHMIRRGRSMKIPVSVKNVTADKYLQTKLRQMNVVSFGSF